MREKELTMPSNKHRNRGNKINDDTMMPPNKQNTPSQDYEDDEIEEMQDTDFKKFMIRSFRSFQSKSLNYRNPYWTGLKIFLVEMKF